MRAIPTEYYGDESRWFIATVVDNAAILMDLRVDLRFESMDCIHFLLSIFQKQTCHGRNV